MAHQRICLVTLTTAILLASISSTSALAQQGSSTDQKNSTPDEPPVLGSAKYESNVADLSIEVNAVDRSASGGLTSLTYTIVNHGDERSDVISNLLSESEFSYPPARLAAPSLLDENEQVRYFTIMNTAEDCVCPAGAGDDGTPTRVPGGESQYVWSTFILPDNVSKVTVEFPDFPPIKDVPVS
ncbi:hypothetical protein NOGI109294_14595 [Nocardiopsis gilva]|uniref:hypothetical protein n=1 Tax=Nocardiopsis gilva TaxID=280236 RepID=UPI001267B8C3|nr:hypothetical protein [Nocardiopsis gilva]